MTVQNRIYSELLPWPEVTAPSTLKLLARYGLELVLAVRPWDLPALGDTAKTFRDAGVRLSAWPMLSDEHGRWANVHNAHEFRTFTLRVCDIAAPADVLFDLEPPFAQARALTKLATLTPALHPVMSARRSAPDQRRVSFAAASAELARTANDIRARGSTVSAAIWPLVPLDVPSSHAWQSMLGTPVDPIAASHVSTMMYTSILEGWSRGVVRRRDARSLLAAATMRTLQRFGGAAGMSLGCVGTGAFADEPTYRDPSELAEDAAIARASGCSRLSLFDLGGVLSRSPAEPWLEAFTRASGALDAPEVEILTKAAAGAALGPSSRRVAAAKAAARVATVALRAFGAVRASR